LYPEEFFGLRELIIVFISASVIGIMFIVGKFPGNEPFKNGIASLFQICVCLIFLKLLKKVIEGICHCSLIF